jgi:hypothetical protein
MNRLSFHLLSCAIAGHKADFALTDAFIADLDAAVADADRQVVSHRTSLCTVREFHFLPARTIIR